MTEASSWPKLNQLRSTSGQSEERRRFIGGSDANIILSGDRQKVTDLWLEKRGEKEALDLSTQLPVILGCWTEPFNRQWFEMLSGRHVARIGEVVVCGSHHFRRATLDGVIEAAGTVWEAKHTSAFAKPDEVLERYMPQLQHNMAVTGYQQAALSVIFGNHKFEIFEIAADWLYQSELLEAERQFWKCVVTGEQPVAADPPPVPRPIGTREVCLDGNNSWASAAVDWLQHRDAAKIHASACAQIKAQIDPDVGRAFGHGIEAKRSKSGAITIKELA